MSIYSAIGRYAKTYGKLLGGRTSAGMLNRTARMGYRAATSGNMDIMGRFGRVGGKTLSRYMWGGATGAERAARIGTAAGAGLLAGNFVNPKNNWGPF